MEVVQRGKTRLSASRGLGLVPGNIENSLRFAHYDTRDGGLPVLGSPIPRKGLRGRAKERGQWGEGAKLQTSFFSTRFLMRIVTMYILFCVHCGDRGGHVPDTWDQCLFII